MGSIGISNYGINVVLESVCKMIKLDPCKQFAKPSITNLQIDLDFEK
jgi:hypothetical protein